MRTKPQYQVPKMIYGIQEDEVGVKLKRARCGKEAFSLLQPGIHRNFSFGFSKTLIALVPTSFLDCRVTLNSTTKDRVEIKGGVNFTYKISEPITFMKNIPEGPRPLDMYSDYNDPSPLDYEGRLIADIVKSKTNQLIIYYKIDEVNEKRAEIEEKSIKVLAEPLKKYGLVIGDFNLNKFELPEFYTFAREKEMGLEFEKTCELKELEFNKEILKNKAEAKIMALSQLRKFELECLKQQKEAQIQYFGDYGNINTDIQKKLIENYLALREKNPESLVKIIKEISSAMGGNNPREVLYALLTGNEDSEELKKFGIDFKFVERFQREIEEEYNGILLKLQNENKRLKGEGEGLEKAIEESIMIKEVGDAAKKAGIGLEKYLEITKGNKLNINLANRGKGQLEKIDKKAYSDE